MKRLITVLLFVVVSVSAAIGIAQAQIRNFHQEGMGTQDIASEEYTATHPSLPLGTQARVTNTLNGKEVIVKIIGRIPASPARIVDLSRGAARDLGLPAQGGGAGNPGSCRRASGCGRSPSASQRTRPCSCRSAPKRTCTRTGHRTGSVSLTGESA